MSNKLLLRFFVFTIIILPFIYSSTVWSSDSPSVQSTSKQTNVLNSLHPAIVVRDSNGVNISKSGLEPSIIQTCNGCHDVEYILNHNDHLISDKKVESDYVPILTDINDPGEQKQRQEINCLACHTAADSTVNLEELVMHNHGVASSKVLPIFKPKNTNCAQCHGVVGTDIHDPIYMDPETMTDSLTLTTGQIISPQKISLSGLNIANKGTFTRSFDVHSERVVDCIGCHYSLNNPTYVQQHTTPILDHLAFDPRRLTINDYLQRPSHQLANFGDKNSGEVSACESCHNAQTSHSWLPALNKHTNAVACETCHIPSVFGPTLESIDWRTMDEEGQAKRGFRNVAPSGLISAYQPTVTRYPSLSGKWTPVNRVTAFYSEHGDPSERSITQTYKLSHGVVTGEWVTKDCRTCHSSSSILESNAESSKYIVGRDTTKWVDRVGALLFLSVLALIAIHSLLRFKSNTAKSNAPTNEEVYMYDRYERFWHWLQAFTIFALLGSGLVLHLPDSFSWISFNYMLQLHQIVGFILLVNALFALFYHIVSGEIKQYLPRPYGLLNDMMAQGVYYLKGIFVGAPHPFHKTKTKKLNPLQKVTYFAILNFLLPAQILVGFVIWSGNYIPEIPQFLGGSNVLMPLHIGLAWLFASFILMHIYLTTTVGNKPTDGIKAMVSGWEHIETKQGQGATMGEKTQGEE